MELFRRFFRVLRAHSPLARKPLAVSLRSTPIDFTPFLTHLYESAEFRL